MKTLEQLWRENGEKPFRAVHESPINSDDYVTVLAVEKPEHFPSPSAIGYDRTFNAANYAADWAVWKLWEEPPPRRIAWICKETHISAWGYVEKGELRFTGFAEQPEDARFFERAPWLDEPRTDKD